VLDRAPHVLDAFAGKLEVLVGHDARLMQVAECADRLNVGLSVAGGPSLEIVPHATQFRPTLVTLLNSPLLRDLFSSRRDVVLDLLTLRKLYGLRAQAL